LNAGCSVVAAAAGDRLEALPKKPWNSVEQKLDKFGGNLLIPLDLGGPAGTARIDEFQRFMAKIPYFSYSISSL
jgi:hypothetical protein